MNDDKDHSTNNHDSSSFTLLIVNRTEKRSQKNGSERQQGRDGTGQIRINIIFIDHQISCIEKEREYGRIEKDAQNCYIPESPVSDYKKNIL